MKWVKLFESQKAADEVLKKRNPIRLKVNGKDLCLTLFDGTYYITENSCPHQRETLSGGTLNYLGELICPLHFYRFNLKTGQECMGRTRDLITYTVKSNEQGIFLLI